MSRHHGRREFANVQPSPFPSDDDSDTSSITDTSADISASSIYPDLSAHKRDAARMKNSFDRSLNKVQSDGFTDGSGDHLPYGAELNTSASSGGGESPGRVLRSSGLGSPRLRSKHPHVELPLHGRQPIHENKSIRQRPPKRRPECAEPHQWQDYIAVNAKPIIIGCLVVLVLVLVLVAGGWWYVRASDVKQERELVELVDE